MLGTLIGSAYTFYATQKTEMNTFAARALQLDIALAEFGPETAPARAMMKDTLMSVRRMLWWGNEPGDMPPNLNVAAPLKELRDEDKYVASLIRRRRLNTNFRRPRPLTPARWSRPGC